MGTAIRLSPRDGPVDNLTHKAVTCTELPRASVLYKATFNLLLHWSAKPRVFTRHLSNHTFTLTVHHTADYRGVARTQFREAGPGVRGPGEPSNLCGVRHVPSQASGASLPSNEAVATSVTFVPKQKLEDTMTPRACGGEVGAPGVRADRPPQPLPPLVHLGT